MANPVSVKIDAREFTETLRRYRQFSKRDPKKICDTKAFFIARRAVLETPKASKEKIRADLGKVVYRKKAAVALNLRTVSRFSRYGLEYKAPLAALIINARARAGAGLYGQRMSEAIRAMLAARMRSVAYIKSGWLPAIKTLVTLADRRGAPKQERDPQQIGRPKGYAIPSRQVDNALTQIANETWTKRDKKALFTYGGPALQRAFNAETATMKEYIQRKMVETARSAGVDARPI